MHPKYAYSNILLFSVILLGLSILSPFTCCASFPQPDFKGLPLVSVITTALQHSPDILLTGQDMEISRGSLQQTRGKFDTTLKAGTSFYEENSQVSEKIERESTTTIHSLKATKQLRNGLSLNSSMELSRSKTDYASQVSPEPAQNKAGIYFTLSVPLLKGRGRDVTGARERAAEVSLEITDLQSRNIICSTVQNTVLAYWQYRTAFEQRQQYQQAEKRAEESIRITQALIKADQAPASLLENAKAKLSTKRSNLIFARQTLYEASQKLGILMGTDFDDMENMPLPATALPTGDYGQVTSLYQNREALITLALSRRHDYLIYDRYIAYSKILLCESQNHLLPKLDMQLIAGYSGWNSGTGVGSALTPLFKNIPGVSGGIRFDLSLPVANSFARGTLVQQQATLKRYEIQRHAQANIVRSRVVTLISALKQRLDQFREASHSVAYYKTATRNVQKKFQLGMATLSDLLLIKDDLDLAISRKINIQQQFAISLAELRYQTATLVKFKDQKGRVDVSDLFSVPQI